MGNKPKNHTHFAKQVGSKATRKLKAQRNASKELWFGLGLMGLIGWAVVVPLLLGVALGLWLDTHYPSQQHHWTLALLVAGLMIGCFNAWLWIAKEDKAMRDEREKEDE